MTRLRAASGLTSGPRPDRSPNEVLQSRLTALLVEDEPSVREVVAKTLQIGGYTVYEAGDPKEAIEACRRLETPVHVLITDITMPQMSGWELAEHLRIMNPALKIIFMSGFGDTRSADSPLHHGAAFVEKPFWPSALLKTLRELFES